VKDQDYDVTEMLHVTDPIDRRGGRLTVERIDEGFRTGYCVPPVDGQPIPRGAELCEMRQRSDGVWEKRVPRSGPAMVNSPAYRVGWDSIFGKQPVGEA